jgi:anti-anti-sigma factor
MRLQLSVGRTGDVAVVRCRGVIVFGPEEDELRLTVLSLLKETNYVVLLLEGVERIDSQGVATLVGLYISARNRGGELKLAEPSPQCWQVLHITRVEKIIEIHRTEEQAVASFHPKKAASA